MKTETIPGIARMKPSTTRRIEAEKEISRSTRRMRSARRTDISPVAGRSAIPTMRVSKMFHPLRRKRGPSA